jgi:halimadienyl-diphosphate synthase
MDATLRANLPPASHLRTRIVSLLQSMVADQHPEFGGGAMSAAAYDTAWVAMVRSPSEPQRLAFPLSLTWLLEYQNEDGSYGGPFPHTLVPTLAALLCLRRAPQQQERTLQAAARAQAYLTESLPRWNVARHESIGFELVVPGLLRELQALGVELPFPARQALMAVHDEKLALFDPSRLYERSSSMAFSLEGFGARLDWTRLRRQQHPNGNYGCSPASTAAALIFGPWDAAAARWLSYLYERGCDGQPGAMPNAFSIDTFEVGWALYDLAHAGFDLGRDCPPELRARLVQWLRDSLGPEGASFSRFPGVPGDSDDTGMVLAALNLCGIPTPVDSLLRFERGGSFVGYESERGAALSANAHVLAALLSLPQAQQQGMEPRIRKLVDFLDSTRSPEGYWVDKWHASPYYGTVCSLKALAPWGEERLGEVVAPAIEWLLGTQRQRDGGWGVGAVGTDEETAYAMQALQCLPPALRTRWGHQIDEALQAGAAWLARPEGLVANPEALQPRLWLGKELYAPRRVVAAIILSAAWRAVAESSQGPAHA